MNGIQFDLTTSQHAAIAQYSYPSNGMDKHVLVDLGHVLPGGSSAFSQQYLGGAIAVNSTTLSSYTGFADYQYGWNRASPWRIFFCGSFDTPFSATSGGLFNYTYDSTQQTPLPNPTLEPFANTSSINGSTSLGVGALFTWGNNSAQTIESRIGISFISAEKACAFVQEELPSSQSFNDTVTKAKALWNGERFF